MMKAFQVIVFVVLAVVIVLGLKHAWSRHVDYQTDLSRERMVGVAVKLTQQIDAYQGEHHSYPPSLEALSLTNGQDGIPLAALPKLQYEITAKGYKITYHDGDFTSVTRGP